MKRRRLFFIKPLITISLFDKGDLCIFPGLSSYTIAKRKKAALRQIGGKMARGRKKQTLEERIRETQQCIYNLEKRTGELYEELEELLEQKKRQELEKLSEALEEAGVSVEQMLERLEEEKSLRKDESRKDKEIQLVS